MARYKRGEQPTTCIVDKCSNPTRARGLCVKHLHKFYRNGSPKIGKNHCATPEESFRDKTKLNADTGCLEWTGSTSNYGYGAIRVNGTLVGAHRYAWIRKYGPIKKGLYILHKCDNPKCCNVNHLRLGTQAENMSEMRERNRHNQVKGEGVNTAKLTETEVLQIRKDDRPRRLIAEEYGISLGNLYSILSRKTWKHI